MEYWGSGSDNRLFQAKITKQMQVSEGIVFAVQIGFYLQLASGAIKWVVKWNQRVIFCDQYRQLLKSLFFLSTCQQRC